MSNQDLYSRILKLCKQEKTTPTELARILGISATNFSNLKYQKNKSVRLNTLTMVANYFGVSVDYLINGESPDPFSAIDNILPLQTKKVPLLGDIACGKPIYADEQHGEYVNADNGINADFCLRAKGDSMINARIYDGDIVFCEKCESVDNGQIAVVIIEDEATLKRVYYYPEKGKLVLNPENPAFEPLIYIGEELNTIHIIGRAVAFQSFMR